MFNYGCARKKKNSVSVFFLLGAVIFSYNMSCLLQPIPDMSANTGREKEEKTGILLLLLISPLFPSSLPFLPSPFSDVSTTSFVSLMHEPSSWRRKEEKSHDTSIAAMSKSRGIVNLFSLEGRIVSSWRRICRQTTGETISEVDLLFFFFFATGSTHLACLSFRNARPLRDYSRR